MSIHIYPCICALMSVHICPRIFHGMRKSERLFGTFRSVRRKANAYEEG